ncbi:MAG: molybdenum cofactor guanylyltransferase MobA [Pseudomonadota bacterium]
MAASEPVTGLILAGGEGRRMGGADKGLLDYRGKPLVAHVVERLAPQVDALLISANRNLEDYMDFGYPVVTDASNERLGPLAGIEAGLRACETPWLVACPCDCPQLPLDLVVRLMAAAKERDAKLAVATTAAGIQPTFLLCRRELLPVLGAALRAGERRVRGWCHCQRAVEVLFPDAAAFANFNTPDALAGPSGN